MTDQQWTIRDELERIRRVSDMMCTGHARLRDRFARRALILDLTILALSTWLVALAFVAPRLNLSLTPWELDPQLWSGLLAVLTFFLTVLQMKVDWKGRSDAHKRSLAIFAEVKRDTGYLLALGGEIDDPAALRVLARYDMASTVSVEIPERQFLQQKRYHRSKIALSKHLDQHPSASITLTRIRHWTRDNIRGGTDRDNVGKS